MLYAPSKYNKKLSYYLPLVCDSFSSHLYCFGYVVDDACPHIKELIAQKRSQPPPKTSYSDLYEWRLLEDKGRQRNINNQRTFLSGETVAFLSNLHELDCIRNTLNHLTNFIYQAESTFDNLGCNEIYYGRKTKDETLGGHTMVIVGYFGDQLIVRIHGVSNRGFTPTDI